MFVAKLEVVGRRRQEAACQLFPLPSPGVSAGAETHLLNFDYGSQLPQPLH